MTWTVRHLVVPTAYFDDDTEFIEPGYYVVGHLGELENALVIFRIEQAIDPAGHDISADVASQVVTILNRASSATSILEES